METTPSWEKKIEGVSLEKLLNHLVNVSASSANIFFYNNSLKINALIDGVDYCVLDHKAKKTTRITQLKDRLLKDSTKTEEGYVYVHVYNERHPRYTLSNNSRRKKIKFYFIEFSNDKIEIKIIEY